MKNLRNITILVLVILMLTAVGLVSYYWFNSGSKNNVAATAFTDDGTNRLSGAYAGIQADKIIIAKKGEQRSYLINTDEIAVQCTTQDLENVSQVDLNLVTKVLVLSKQQLQNFLPLNQPVFLISAEVNGQPKVHTVVIQDSVCPTGNL